jgi:spore germination protein YaaH
MDEQVIDDLYARAQSKGYKKGRLDFIQLIQSDEDVFNDMYQYVQSKGYKKDSENFSFLIGKTEAPAVKKKRYGIRIGGWFFGLTRA